MTVIPLLYIIFFSETAERISIKSGIGNIHRKFLSKLNSVCGKWNTKCSADGVTRYVASCKAHKMGLLITGALCPSYS
jgi:hypothetical protein